MTTGSFKQCALCGEWFWRILADSRIHGLFCVACLHAFEAHDDATIEARSRLAPWWRDLAES